ncbi:hypothetical protein RISK_005448 [Rhodopirellula islandica]|uniref:Uncharacterized protein n=1 Tax=Rhodopirellula islandica TaxID=595434 RepID=A0A0J1B6P0_RHOIS|nr:hypothetical protein RISK_005448 [Rhodopirellula islandica]
MDIEAGNDASGKHGESSGNGGRASGLSKPHLRVAKLVKSFDLHDEISKVLTTSATVMLLNFGADEVLTNVPNRISKTQGCQSDRSNYSAWTLKRRS